MRLARYSSKTTAIRSPALDQGRVSPLLRDSIHALSRSGYGNASQLQLALRGLEQGDLPVRIGIVGSDPASLVQILLRDPFVSFVQDHRWVDILQRWGLEKASRGCGLSIRSAIVSASW